MQEVDDPISLSFVDCISCGLAAATFLFLIFAAIPRAAALAEAEMLEAGEEGTTGSGLLPPLFQGMGVDVPVDIRVSLERPILESEPRWENITDSKNLLTYSPATGKVSAFLATLRSLDVAPVFYLDNPNGNREVLRGTISIKAGPDTAPIVRFECAPASPGTTLTVLSFINGMLASDCLP